MILDTNALSAWAEGDPRIKDHLNGASLLVVPSIVLGEYYFGIRRSRHFLKYQDWLKSYLPHTKIAAANHATALTYATIREELKCNGSPIPPNDTWIAAIARQHQLSLLSNDRHFDSVLGIKRISFDGL